MIHPRHRSIPDRTRVRAHYRMASFSVDDRKHPAPSRREIELSKVITEAVTPAVFVESCPRTAIDIYIEVIQADGGTRTAAITGAYIALEIALNRLIKQKLLSPNVVKNQIAAVSVGIVDGVPLLDLCYEEDKSAEVDANIVMNEKGNFIEIQSTAEIGSFSSQELKELLNLAESGITELLKLQRAVLNEVTSL